MNNYDTDTEYYDTAHEDESKMPPKWVKLADVCEAAGYSVDRKQNCIHIYIRDGRSKKLLKEGVILWPNGTAHCSVIPLEQSSTLRTVEQVKNCLSKI